MKYLCFLLLFFSTSLHSEDAQDEIKPEDATSAIIKAFDCGIRGKAWVADQRNRWKSIKSNDHRSIRIFWEGQTNWPTDASAGHPVGSTHGAWPTPNHPKVSCTTPWLDLIQETSLAFVQGCQNLHESLPHPLENYLID